MGQGPAASRGTLMNQAVAELAACRARRPGVERVSVRRIAPFLAASGKVAPIMKPCINQSIVAVLLLSLPISAWPRGKEPPLLEPQFVPLPTSVETSAQGTDVTFGDRAYRVGLLTVEGQDRPRVVGRITQRSHRKPDRWEVWKATSPADLVTLLPGFGFVLTHEGTPRANEPRSQSHYLLRGVDGVINPPIPSSGRDNRPVVIRSGIDPDGLLADRTLVIMGSREDYVLHRGEGTNWTATPVEFLQAFAWLFDRNGLVRTWVDLQDLKRHPSQELEPPAGEYRVPRREGASRYLSHSPAGSVLFATPGEDGTLTIHVLDPDLEGYRSIPRVRLVRQQTEQPTRDHVSVNAIGGHVLEKGNWLNPSNYRTALLAPLPDHEGWYGVVDPDGNVTVPGGGVALKPLSYKRRFFAEIPGMRQFDYELAYGFLIAHDTDQGRRYGWASPGLTAVTGPLWKQARLVASERIPAEATAQTNIDPNLLLVQFETGEWQVHPEPKVQMQESSFLEPNTFSGMIPPAATPEEAVMLAEAVVIAMDRQRARAGREAFERTMAVIREERQEAARRRAVERAEREKAWAEAMTLLTEWSSRPRDPGPRIPTAEPSALGPDYYWYGGELIFRPTNRTVR